MKDLENEVQLADQKVHHYTDLYYESHEIGAIRRKVQSERMSDFHKLTAQTKNDVHFCVPRESANKRKTAQLYPSANESTNADTLRVFCVRSTQNLRRENERDSIHGTHSVGRSDKSVFSKSGHIYISKTRFSPTSTVYRNKITNHRYTQNVGSQSVDGRNSVSLSKSKLTLNFSKEKPETIFEKGHSLDAQKRHFSTDKKEHFSKEKKMNPVSIEKGHFLNIEDRHTVNLAKGHSLSSKSLQAPPKREIVSYNSRNYLAELKEKRQSSKVKKSFRSIHKPNFNFVASVHRI